MKERLARLVPAVERELREAEVRHAQKRSEEELRRAHEELEMRVEKRTADLKTANLKLQSLLEERRRLENELLEIAENERRRIGFDLHDDLGQKLTGLLLMLKGLEKRLDAEQHACAPDVRKMASLIEQIIHHTHNLAHHFSSLDVQGDDLASALKGLTDNVKKMFDLACGFSVKGVIPSLPEHTTMQFYKIAQEAVSNAIKHGKATRVGISLIRNGERLIMTVKNDGQPFEAAAKAKNRMGLRIMNFRANTIGASLEIQAGEKSGTIVTCALPIKKSANRRPVKQGDNAIRKPRLSRSPQATSVAMG
jgi:signal transduction histidine kinase